MMKSDPARPERSRFWRRTSVQRMIGGFIAIMLVVVIGVVGYVAMGWDPFDAFYMVVITMSTVGYGEVHPLTTMAARVHTISIIVLGTLAVGFTMAAVIQLFTEGEILSLLGHQRMRRQIEHLSGHTLVAGYGRVGSLVCDELAAVEEPFVVIERSTQRIAEIERRAFLYVAGDATEESVLAEAGLKRAKVLVTAMPSDAETVFITLTARQMAPNVEIVARAEQPTTVKKLRQAGANHVVLPSSIGAHRIVSLLMNPTAVEFAELVTKRSSLAIVMDEVPIQAAAALKGLTLRDADIGRKTGVIVIAVKRADGRVEFPPSGDEPFAEGDSVVLLGRRPNLDEFRAQFAS